MNPQEKDIILGNALLHAVTKMIPIISEENHSNLDKVEQEDILKNLL